jgi:hypothetical protein
LAGGETSHTEATTAWLSMPHLMTLAMELLFRMANAADTLHAVLSTTVELW